MGNRVEDWEKYNQEQEFEDNDFGKPTPSPKRKKGLTRGEQFLLKAIKKKRSKRGGVVSAFGLNRGRIRY